jgi:hypothetical protein
MSTPERCPHTHDCELYSRFRLKGALRIWQQRFCDHPTQHQKCARFIRVSAGEPVPPTLLPNGEQIPT